MTRSRNQQKDESDTKVEVKRKGETEDTTENLVPKWVKTAGAIAGIVVALLGAFVGIYQVAVSLRQIDVNIEKERRGSEEAKFKQAEEDRKKAEVEANRSLAEEDSKVALRDKDLEVKRAEVAKETVARYALQLSIDRDVKTKTLDEQFKIEAERRVQSKEDTTQFSETLHGVFSKENPLPSLARLTPYATPGDGRLGSILTPLVAKLDDVKTASEVNIVFQLFEKAGPSALASVIDSNRNALERYKTDVKKLALAQFNFDRKLRLEQIRADTEKDLIPLLPILERSTSNLMSTQDPNSGLATLQRNIIEDVWDQITRAASGGRGSYRELRYGLMKLEMKPEALKNLEVPFATEAFDYLQTDLSLQLAILRQSKRSLLRLLKQTKDFVDLTGTEVSGMRFVSGEYGSMDFSDAFVAGADFTAARLDPTTLVSLGDAYVAPDQRVRDSLSNQGAWTVRFSPQQVATIAGTGNNRN